MDDTRLIEKQLRSEILRLQERLERQTRDRMALEAMLRKEREAASSPTISASDPILPVANGTSLDTSPTSYGPQSAGVISADESGVHMRNAIRWPQTTTRDVPLSPHPGWRNLTLRRRVRKIIGVSVCELPDPIIEQAVARVAEQQERSRDFIPVFLTDTTNFEIFRMYGYNFEYVPCRSKRQMYYGSIAWEEYCLRRREIVKRKWGMIEVISFGQVEFGVAREDTASRQEIHDKAAEMLLPTSPRESGRRVARTKPAIPGTRPDKNSGREKSLHEKLHLAVALHSNGAAYQGKRRLKKKDKKMTAPLRDAE